MSLNIVSILWAGGYHFFLKSKVGYLIRYSRPNDETLVRHLTSTSSDNHMMSCHLSSLCELKKCNDFLIDRYVI